MNKFNVKLEYTNKENCPHCAGKLNRSIVESFTDVPEKSMIGLMIDLLDLPFEDKNNVIAVVEPSSDKLRESLGVFAQDEKFFKSELKRQKKAYAVFKDITLFVKNYGKDVIELSLSKNEKVRVEAAH